MLLEHTRSDLEDLPDELDDWAGVEFRSCRAELLQGHETGVRASQNTVTITIKVLESFVEGYSRGAYPGTT